MTKKQIFSGSLFLIAIISFGCLGAYFTQRQEISPGNNQVANPPVKNSSEITEVAALAKIRELPEVKDWEARVTQSNGTTRIVIDSQDSNYYSVHVYEDMPDHVATFNWYSVDKKTGDISVS